MSRVTQKEMEAVFHLFVTAGLGGRVAESYGDVGAYRIDGAYSGYKIERIYSKGGAVSSPFGHGFLPKRELVERMRFALDMKSEIRKREREQS